MQSKDAPILSYPNGDDGVVLVLPERRFKEYFEMLTSIEHKHGDIEPAALKAIRPFLLENEVSTVSSQMFEMVKSKRGNKKKGNHKGKNKRRNSLTNRELSKVYTAANPVPFPNYYNPSNVPFHFTQEQQVTSFFTTSTTVPTFSAVNFNVNGIDQISQLTAIFDQYMIDQVEIWLECALGVGAAETSGAQQLAVVVDYDDSNNLTTFPSALDYTNVVTCRLGESIYRRFRPHIAIASYSGTFTSFANSPSQWIDAASPSVQHYGIKLAAGTSTAAIIYSLRIRYHTKWRNVR